MSYNYDHFIIMILAIVLHTFQIKGFYLFKNAFIFTYTLLLFSIILGNCLKSFLRHLNVENSNQSEQLIWTCVCRGKWKFIQYTYLTEILTTSCHESQIR